MKDKLCKILVFSISNFSANSIEYSKLSLVFNDKSNA